ncbi:hypothetical protein EZJ49_09600 [Bdellovibrio bacteriovorus]|uniref:hypothetical protein n=1 Tax=Bdellovibrio bacteriovorus TaxID=959 RepID=UPI0021D2D85A|nr:hypothetical protein [Bdellovibrio bacteriovorus]UXR63328.1 hypothetical protein EZJ49_09600 [Bdellovibrio bacteriovorus]
MKMQLHMTAVLLTSCLLGVQAFATGDTESTGKSMGAKVVSEISFEEGKAILTDETKNDLREKVKEAQQQGKIDEMKVAVWADREYPAEGTKASKQDVTLANDRAKALKNFIKDELKVNSVNTYNMTERPNALQRFVRTDTAKTKTAMEERGAAPRTQDETGFFNQRAKASKAVIMIYTK